MQAPSHVRKNDRRARLRSSNLLAKSEQRSLWAGHQASEPSLKSSILPFKQRLHSWYSRLGYRAIGTEDVAKALPDIEKTVIPCDLVTYEKVL